MAVHDLAARALGVPVHRLLGVDTARMPITSFSIGIDTPEVVAAKVREADDYHVLKVKVGTPDDRAIIGAVRSVTRKPIRVDANEAWKDPAEALAHIEWLAAQGVELVEQPMPAADLEAARWLRARSPLPLIADEAVLSGAELVRIADAYHGVNVKLMKHGGIAPTLDLIAVARALGLQVMIGCMIESGLGIAAAAHIAPLCDWVDLDGNLLLAEDPFPGHPVVDGRLALRDAPGLGVAPGESVTR
jgi:L-Ala-D/L-Glu epimerase